MDASVIQTQSYTAGEEVVVRLAGLDAYNVDRGAAVEAACLPSWTIGIVMSRCLVDGDAAYVLRIVHDGCACLCVAPIEAIEGVA